MPKRKVTRELALRVWEQLESGTLPEDTDAPSQRTAERLRDALRQYDLGYPDGQIVKGWEQLVKELRPAHEEYRRLHPKTTKPRVPKARTSRRGAYSSPVPDISRLLDSMWVPDPHEMDGFDPFDQRTCFRIEQVGSRDLSWQQVEGKVLRCWLRVEEEEVLKEALDRLPEEDSGRLQGLYERLQNRLVEYFGQAIESQKGFAMVGQVPGVDIRGIPHLALRFKLARETPQLIELVDEFIRSVQVAMIRAANA